MGDAHFGGHHFSHCDFDAHHTFSHGHVDGQLAQANVIQVNQASGHDILQVQDANVDVNGHGYMHHDVSYHCDALSHSSVTVSGHCDSFHIVTLC